MKKFFIILCALLCSQMICLSEEIRFDNEVYKLKFSALAPKTNGYGNEYFIPSENYNNWSKMIGIYYYPNENDPIIFANKFDKTIENTDNSILLKFIENKKTNQSVISFLVNECEKSKKYFEYDIYKFEKQQPKGMIVTKYAVKYFFNNDNEINQIAQKVKANNDRYLEMLILSQTPQIIEKDIAFEN